MHKVVPKGEVDAAKQHADGQDEGRKRQEHRATQLEQLSGTRYQALHVYVCVCAHVGVGDGQTRQSSGSVQYWQHWAAKQQHETGA